MQKLVGQLDLAIYPLQAVSIWRHPFIIIGLVFLFASLGVALWWVRRKFKRKVVVPVADILVDLLNKGIDGIKQGQISLAEAVALLISILKSYTAWLIQDKSVKGMTDQQWSVFVKTVKPFKPYLDDIDLIVSLANQVKFNYAQIGQKQVIDWFERSIQIINQINADLIQQ